MDSPDPIQFQFAGASHAGHLRPENQDRHGAFATPIGQVYAVADGMGGHQGGAFAAELTIQLLQETLVQTQPYRNTAAALRGAIQVVNQEVHRQSTLSPERIGMGSTLVCAALHGSVATIAHIGDSRAYLWRRGKLQRLTRDHTIVEPLVESGALSEDSARNHYQSSTLTRALGPHTDVEPAISAPIILEPGDALLLCSDGLSGVIPGDEIETAISANPDPRRAAGRLIELALAAGGEDNITVQVIASAREDMVTTLPLVPDPSSSINRKRIILGLLTMAALALGLNLYLRRATVTRVPVLTVICNHSCQPSESFGRVREWLRRNPEIKWSESIETSETTQTPGVYFVSAEDAARATELGKQLGMTASSSIDSTLQAKHADSDIFVVVKGAR